MIHIVMPFSRPHLMKQIIKNYKDSGIILHPIQHENLEWKEDWIQPIQYEVHECFDICYDKLNFFKKEFSIIDDDYYWVSGDDDKIDSDLIEKVKKMDHDVIVVSLNTGTDVPTEGSNCNIGILWAVPENMKRWRLGLSQIIMKGKFFKEAMYKEDTHVGDGEMAAYVKEHYDVHYEPELFVKHNYYQPGRWERLGDKEFYEGI
jgi:hypothetical protein